MALACMNEPGDFIDGRFVAPTHVDGRIELRSPADRSEIVARHGCTQTHVDDAVDSARRAFPAWRALSDEARAAVLRRYQAELRARRDEIAQTIAAEVGKPLWEARTEADAMIAKIDVALGEGASYVAARRLDDLPGEVRWRPHGVLAVIGPFNFPGHLPNGQIVPALLAGNTVVHKPSEKAPSSAVWIARSLAAAGLPPGVFNLVQGMSDTGARLARHDGVDGVLFTGSVDVGRRILADTAAHPGRIVALELGGKNAAVVLDDCDLERSARALAFGAFATAGQRCTSTSRLFVTAGVADALVARLTELAESLRVGYPLDPDVFTGPLVEEAAIERLRAAQTAARDSGYEPVVAGGPARVAGHDGFYVRPAIHRAPGGRTTGVPAYEDAELFGPDLAVYVVADEAAAVEGAARTRFGLVASVFTRSRERFERVADALRVGVVHWNRPTSGASSRLPFGGIGDSGNHRPAGAMMSTSCAYPLAVLLDGDSSGALPAWPGLPAETRSR